MFRGSTAVMKSIKKNINKRTFQKFTLLLPVLPRNMKVKSRDINGEAHKREKDNGKKGIKCTGNRKD